MARLIFGKSLAALLSAAVSLASVSYAQADTLRIGYQKSATTLGLLRSGGTLEKRLAAQGFEVSWTEFPGGPQLLEGLNVGSVDFGLTGETPPVFAQAAGADLLYVAYEPASPGAEAILVAKDSGIQTVAELKGKRVALNKGSNVHYLLVRALEEAGLTLNDVQPVYLPPSDARAAFESGAVAAWVIWDPFQAAAEQQLKARTLRDGEGLVNNYQFYLSTKPFAEKNPAVLEAVIEEIRAVGEHVKADYAAATAKVAPVLGLPEDITRIAIERQHYGAAPINEKVSADQQKIADTFTDLKLIPKRLSIADVVWQQPAKVAKAQ